MAIVELNDDGIADQCDDRAINDDAVSFAAHDAQTRCAAASAATVAHNSCDCSAGICAVQLTNLRHPAKASRFKSCGHLSLPCRISCCQRLTTDCGLTSRLRCRSGKSCRHRSMALAFSCNAMAHERVLFGIAPNPCFLIQSENSRP